MKSALLVTLAVVLAGCATQSTSDEIAATPAPSASGLPLEVIERQTLAEGQCGLALWARAAAQERIFYAVDTAAQATVRLRGQDMVLARQAQSGDIARGFAPEQVYQAGDVRISIDLTIETRDGMLSGAVVRDGVLTLDEGAGRAALVLPVVGLIGCR